MSPSQAEAHGLALSRASENIEPYTLCARKTFYFNVAYNCCMS